MNNQKVGKCCCPIKKPPNNPRTVFVRLPKTIKKGKRIHVSAYKIQAMCNSSIVLLCAVCSFGANDTKNSPMNNIVAWWRKLKNQYQKNFCVTLPTLSNPTMKKNGNVKASDAIKRYGIYHKQQRLQRNQRFIYVKNELSTLESYLYQK